MTKIFDNWGEEFLISFDFNAFDYPPAVTNILHIYDYYYDYYYYGQEPQDDGPLDGYGRVIPGCKTFQP